MIFRDAFDGFLCDLDGVVYAGAGAIDGAPESLRALDVGGSPVGYVTNNASRSEATVAAHLRELGAPAPDGTVFGSAVTGVELLSRRVSPDARVFVVGSASLEELVREAGLSVVGLEEMEAGDGADAVIQGFEPTISWRHLAAASYAVSGGAAWVATNTDTTIPRAEGVAPGNGMLVAAVEQATGQQPEVAGKPEAPIFERAARELRLKRPLVVGDRLDTDIAGGINVGFATALVLTGIHTREDAEQAPASQRPDFVIGSLRDLVSNADIERFRMASTSETGVTA